MTSWLNRFICKYILMKVRTLNLIISLGDYTAGADQTIVVGPVLPGIYSCVANYKDTKLTGFQMSKLHGSPSFINGKTEYILKRRYQISLNPGQEFKTDLRTVLLAAVRTDNSNQWGYIDETGQVVVDPQFGDEGLNDNRIVEMTKRNEFEQGNNDNKLVIISNFSSPSFSNGLAIVEVNKKFGWVDTNKKMVISARFDRVLPFIGDLAAVELGAKWGYIDKTGKMVIPAQFDETLSSKSDGLAPSKIGDKWGYIDKTGKTIITAQFEMASVFNDGMAVVKKAIWDNR